MSRKLKKNYKKDEVPWGLVRPPRKLQTPWWAEGVFIDKDLDTEKRRVQLLKVREPMFKTEKIDPPEVENNRVEMPSLRFVQPTEWRDNASCAKLPKSVFFPEILTKEKVAEARAVCNNCPVLLECYEFAVRNDERYGVWAGTTPNQRSIAYKKLVATGILETPQAA